MPIIIFVIACIKLDSWPANWLTNKLQPTRYRGKNNNVHDSNSIQIVNGKKWNEIPFFVLLFRHHFYMPQLHFISRVERDPSFVSYATLHNDSIILTKCQNFLCWITRFGCFSVFICPVSLSCCLSSFESYFHFTFFLRFFHFPIPVIVFEAG